jgi:hypothetical protein
LDETNARPNIQHGESELVTAVKIEHSHEASKTAGHSGKIASVAKSIWRYESHANPTSATPELGHFQTHRTAPIRANNAGSSIFG